MELESNVGAFEDGSVPVAIRTKGDGGASKRMSWPARDVTALVDESDWIGMWSVDDKGRIRGSKIFVELFGLEAEQDHRWGDLEVGDVEDPSLQHLIGRRMGDIAAERGVDAFDAMLDVAVAPLLWRLDYYGITMPKPAAALMKYAERLFARPAFSEALTSAERGMRK